MSRSLKTTFGVSVFAWIALLFSIAFMGVPLRMRFETNDDVFMMMIASGRYTGTPSEFLLYMHVLAGLFLKGLFTFAPAFNSYLVLFCLMHVSFAVAVASVLSRMTDGVFRLVLLWAVLIFFHLPICLRLQFTTTAFVAAIGGVLFLSDSALNERPDSRMVVRFGLAAAGWLGAYLVRRESALLAVAVASPLLLYTFFLTARRMLFAGFAAGMILVTCGLMAFQTAYIARFPEWKQFLDFNEVRGRMHVAPGYAYDADSARIFGEVGWSENDVEVFHQWFFPDPHVHSEEHVRHIAMQLRRPRQGAVAIQFWLHTVLQHRFKLIAAAFLFLGALLGADRRVTLLAGTLVAVSIVLQIYLDATARLPLRVLMPLLYSPAIMLLPIGSRFRAAEACRVKHARTIWMALCLVLAARGVFHDFRLSGEHREMETAWASADYHVPPGALLVLWADDWPVEWARPRLRLDPPGDSARYLSLSSLTRSPHNNMVLRQFGVENLMEDVLLRDNIFLVCREVRLPMLRRYMMQHHDAEIECEDRGGLFARRIYRIRKREPGADSENDREG